LQAEARLAELQEERENGEAARADAEAAHEAAVVGAAIRAEALGFDRADRHYWWFPGAACKGIMLCLMEACSSFSSSCCLAMIPRLRSALRR